MRAGQRVGSFISGCIFEPTESESVELEILLNLQNLLVS